MKRILSLTAVVLALFATPAVASTWVGLGGNVYGELGAGFAGRSQPYPVASTIFNAIGAQEADASYFSGFALAGDGTVYGVGGNNFGQIGDGNRETTLVPQQALGLSSVVEISSDSHTLARTADGSVYSWGGNWAGALGLGIPGGENGVRVPTRVALPLPAVKVFAGGANGGAVLTDGSLWVWGENKVGQTGQPTTVKEQDTPYELLSSGVRSAVYGGLPSIGGHLLVLMQDGTVQAVGGNASGQLGTGSRLKATSTLAPVAGLTNVVALSADIEHSLALTADGTVYAWGGNQEGQVGDGTLLAKRTPVAVLQGASLIAAGFRWSFAVVNGALYGWGRNDHRQLADGNTDSPSVPTPTGLTGVSYIQASEYGGFARAEAGFTAPPIAAVPSAGQLALSWTAVGTSRWFVQWRSRHTLTWTGVHLPVTATSYTITGLASGEWEARIISQGVGILRVVRTVP